MRLWIAVTVALLLASLASTYGQEKARPAPTPGAVSLKVLFPPTNPHQRKYDEVQNYLLNKNSPAFPLIAGAVIRVEWSDFDLGDAKSGAHAKYDFQLIDEMMSPWLAAGKTVNLVLHMIPYGEQDRCPDRGPGSYGESDTGNCAMPAWMWNALGDSNYVTCAGVRSPNFFAPAFQSNYQAAVSALVKHYAASNSVVYIRVGLGKGGEINLPRGWQDPSTPCGEAYTSRWGYTVGDSEKSTWNAYLKKMLDFEGTLTASKQLMVSVTPVPARGVNPEEVSDYIAPIAVRNGVGFGNQGLSPESMRDCTGMQADWCALFDRFQTKVPLELQTLGQSCPTGEGQCEEDSLHQSQRQGGGTNNGPWPGGPRWAGRRAGQGPAPAQMSSQMGSLVPLLPFALKHHAAIIEVYCEDWLVAFSPDHPENSRYGAEYAQALKQAAEGK
jgi:hypothetical protein